MSGDVMVVAEHQGGHLSDITFELLAAGRELATGLGTTLSGVILGQDIAEFTRSIEADHIVCLKAPQLAQFAPAPYLAALKSIVSARSPRLVLLGSTSQGLDLAAPLASSLGIPLVAYCYRLWVEDGQVIAQSQLYGGKLFVETVLPDRGIAALLPGSKPSLQAQPEAPRNIEDIQLASDEVQPTRLLRMIEPESAEVDITRHEKLVAVGRGIGDKENLALAEELAEALGGALCASRPIVDNGWLPKSRQVGKSGLTVKPRLYLAAGISGAPEHLEGMKGSELIIAINSDPKAPIFDVAHYAVVGDLFDILPALTEALRSRGA